MYEEQFDPVEDPSTLSVDELLTRAYALGVAASMGESRPGELDRLLEGADGVYERNLLEVAHQEGRQEAREVTADADGDDPSPWAVLVTGDAAPADDVDPGDRSDDDARGPRAAVEGPPDAVELMAAIERSDRDPEMTDLPEFL